MARDEWFSGSRPPCARCRIASACIPRCPGCSTTGTREAAARGSARIEKTACHAAEQEAKIGPNKDIPHITAPIVLKCITTLSLTGLL